MPESELDEIDLYLEELKSKDLHSRLDAIQVLGETDDVRAFQALTGLLKERKREIVQAAVKALAAPRNPRSVPVLVPLLSHSDVSVRIEAQFALVRIGAGAVEGLIQATYDATADVWAATALGLIGDSRATPALLRLLEHPDSGVRATSCQALEKIRDPAALEPLIARLEDDSMLARRNAASALGEMGDPDAVEPLLRSLGDEEWEVRVNAVRALGKIGDPRAIAPLMDALRYEGPRNGPFDDVRKAAEAAIDACSK